MLRINMKTTVLLIIIILSLVFTNSHANINSIASLRNANPWIKPISTTIKTTLRNIGTTSANQSTLGIATQQKNKVIQRKPIDTIPQFTIAKSKSTVTKQKPTVKILTTINTDKTSNYTTVTTTKLTSTTPNIIVSRSRPTSATLFAAATSTTTISSSSTKIVTSFTQRSTNTTLTNTKSRIITNPVPVTSSPSNTTTKYPTTTTRIITTPSSTPTTITTTTPIPITSSPTSTTITTTTRISTTSSPTPTTITTTTPILTTTSPTPTTTPIPTTTSPTPTTITTTTSSPTPTTVKVNTTSTNTITTRTRTTTTPTSTTTSSTALPTTSYPLFTPLSSDYWPHTKILTKKGLNLRNHADKSIQIASPQDGDFLTLIRDSSFWVDKSLLIRRIFEGLWNYNFVITAPPKWGKTINLSMLKLYCELPVNSEGFQIPTSQSPSYLYFNEGKVVHENGTIEKLDGTPLIQGYDHHLASHPVIYLSGTNLSIDNGTEYLRAMIHQTYRNHDRLLYQLKTKFYATKLPYRVPIQQNINEFLAFYEPERISTLDENKLIFSMQILTKLLYYIYQRQVVIFFDDYDSFAHKAYFSGQPSNTSDYDKQFAHTWGMFLRWTFKQNPHLEKAIITGVVKICDPLSLTKFPNFYGAYVFDDQDLFPFYGIFEKEFRQMATKRDIDSKLIAQAAQWYGGYRTLSHLDVEMYSPYSVTRFLSTLKIQNYWQSSILSEFVHSLFRRPEVQQCIRNMVKSFNARKNFRSVIFPKNFKFLRLKEYVEIQRIEQGEIKYDGENEEYIFSLLVSTGYVAVYKYSMAQSLIKIKIPNREIFDQITAVINEPNV